MDVSSRTPEGVPNRCPVCGKRVVLEPSDPAGDAPCSHCGHLLWFTDAEGSGTLIVRWPDGRTVVVVDQLELDAAWVMQVGEEILGRSAAPQLVLDLSRVELLSTAALGKLITLDKRIRAHGGTFKLRNLRPQVYDVFQITRLDRFFEIEPADAPS